MSTYDVEFPVDPHSALAAFIDTPSSPLLEDEVDTSVPDRWCPAGIATVHVTITIHGRPVATSYQRITSSRPPQLARYSTR